MTPNEHNPQPQPSRSSTGTLIAPDPEHPSGLVDALSPGEDVSLGEGYQERPFVVATPPVAREADRTPSFALALQVPQLPAYEQFGDPSGQSRFASPQFAPAQPLSPYAPMPGQLLPPWGAGIAPTPPQKKRGHTRLLLVLLVLLVLAGSGVGGTLYYLATRPKPVIAVTSQYVQGSTLVGALSTTFQVTGHDFTSHLAITFLLDGRQAPGSQAVQSDSTGAVAASLTVTDAWSLGHHTLTAKDASGYLTNVGVPITVVVQGQASTPGPNGAPTDSASGSILVTVQAPGGWPTPFELVVSGSPSGGTICRTQDDGQGFVPDGHPHVLSGTTSNGVSYTITLMGTCSGTYQGGKLTYTETMTSLKAAYSNGLKCIAQVPFTANHVDGVFTNATALSGTYSSDPITFDCNRNVTYKIDAITGTWTGVASMQ